MSGGEPGPTMLTVLVGVALFALAALSVLRPRSAVGGEGMALLRCLWPAWRFFDVVAQPPRLRFRLLGESHGAENWQALPGPPTRAWYSLFADARGNLELAYATLVERLLEELDGCSVEHAHALVSYRLVQRRIEARLRELGHAGVEYEFSLSDADTNEALFVSAAHRTRA